MYIRWKRNVDDAHAPKFTVTPPPSPERSYLLHSNARNAYLCASYLCVAKGSFRRSLCARALGAGETRANASRKSPQPRGEESLRERSGHTRQGQTTRAIQLANSFIPLHCTSEANPVKTTLPRASAVRVAEARAAARASCSDVVSPRNAVHRRSRPYQHTGRGQWGAEQVSARDLALAHIVAPGEMGMPLRHADSTSLGIHAR